MQALPNKLLFLNGELKVHGVDWTERDGGGYTLNDLSFVADSDNLTVVDLEAGTVEVAEDADVTAEPHGKK